MLAVGLTVPLTLVAAPSAVADTSTFTCPAAPQTSYSVGPDHSLDVTLPSGVEKVHATLVGGNGASIGGNDGGYGAMLDTVVGAYQGALTLNGGSDGTFTAGGATPGDLYDGGAPAANGGGGGGASWIAITGDSGGTAAIAGGGGGAGSGAVGGSAVGSSATSEFVQGEDGASSTTGAGGKSGGGAAGSNGDGTAHSSDYFVGNAGVATGGGGGGGGYLGGGGGSSAAGGGAGGSMLGENGAGGSATAPVSGELPGVAIDFPVITAVSSIGFAYGQTSSFTVCTTGTTSVNLTWYVPRLDGNAPSRMPNPDWLTETDNGDGSYTFSGTPPAAWLGQDSLTLATTSTDGGTDRTNMDVSMTGAAAPAVSDHASAATLSYGQPVTLTATVADPDDCAAVDCVTPFEGISFLDANNQDACPSNLSEYTNPSPNSETASCELTLNPGTHVFTPSYTPASNDPFAAEALPELTVQVNKRATHVSGYIQHDEIYASVQSLSSELGSKPDPAGSLTFFADGRRIGTRKVQVHASSTFRLHAPAKIDRFTVAYSGDRFDLPSSHTFIRPIPRVKTTLTSRFGETKYGWFRAPVTLTFTCVNSSCDYTKTFRQTSPKGVRVTERLVNIEGGSKTVTSPLIRIDRVKPKLSIFQRYDGDVVCDASDAKSGLATTSCTHHRQGRTVTWTAKAVDKAGNVTIKHLVLELPFH